MPDCERVFFGDELLVILIITTKSIECFFCDVVMMCLPFFCDVFL